MTVSTPRSSTRGIARNRAARGTAVVAGIAAMALAASGGTAHAASAVGLGTATSFAVIAGAGITNTGPTTVNGDLGTFPTTAFTGSASVTVSGTNHGGDGVTQGAKANLVTAYDNAAGQGPTTPIVADLGGQTLVAGVYNSGSSIGLTGALTLDGAGNPNAVFIFQAASALTTASGSTIVLVNSAQSCNVFWEVGSSATLGTGSTFRGTIMALSDITVTTGVQVDGRVLARNGAVTLDTDVITRPSCAAAATATPTVVPSTTPTATPTTTSTKPVATATPTPTRTTPHASATVSATSAAGSGRTSRPQVTATPVGGVHAGDGSTRRGMAPVPYGFLLAGGIAGLAAAVRRRLWTRH